MSYTETEEYKGYRIRIVQDDDASSPDEDDGFPVYLAHFHRDFEVCNDDLPFNTMQGCEDFLKEYCEPCFPRDWDGVKQGKDNYETDEDFVEDCEYNRDENDEAWVNHDELNKEWAVFHVSAYIHGGVVLALAGSARDAMFPDRQWDVSHCGVVMVRKDGEWGTAGADDDGYSYERDGETVKTTWRELAENHVNTWDQYLSGDVWGYIIERAWNCSECGTHGYEELESCWGFYGQEYCLVEAKSVVDYLKSKQVAS
jgi:hypothetical protein